MDGLGGRKGIAMMEVMIDLARQKLKEMGALYTSTLAEEPSLKRVVESQTILVVEAPSPVSADRNTKAAPPLVTFAGLSCWS